MLTREFIQAAKEYALREIEEYGIPALEHFLITEQKGPLLAERLGADKDIVQAGVYLMDLKLGEAMNKNILSDHPQMGAEESKKLLSQHQIDVNFSERILNCIAAHHKQIPFTCIEAEICANADCYRFIHPRGFFAYLSLLGTRELTFEQRLNMAEGKLDEKFTILSIELCKQELTPFYHQLKEYIRVARNFS